MQAAQTHGHVKVHIQTITSTHNQLDVMEEVQQSSGEKTHQEDGQHQRAGLDVQPPVVGGLFQLTDDPGVAHQRDPQWHQEAEDAQEDVVVEQGSVEAGVQREDIMAGDEVQSWESVALLGEELGDHSSTKRHPHGRGDPGRAHPLRKAFVHERVHNGHVALDGDAGQRLGRAVQVAIETGRDHPAGGLSQSPVVSTEMVVSLEEEGEEKQEVGEGQAAVEDRRGHLPDVRGKGA